MTDKEINDRFKQLNDKLDKLIMTTPSSISAQTEFKALHKKLDEILLLAKNPPHYITPRPMDADVMTATEYLQKNKNPPNLSGALEEKLDKIISWLPGVANSR